MQKTIIILGVLILLGACATILLISEISDVDDPNESDKEKLAETWLLEMVDGSFENVENNMSDEVKSGLPPGTLSAIFQEMLALEKFGNINSTNSEVNKDITSIQMTSDLSTKNLVFTMAFNDEDKIVGVGYSFSPLPPPTPIETDVLKEKSINIGEFNLNGILTVPKNSEKTPIAILIQGSGISNLDASIGKGGNKPFKDIAHGLAENGISSIRYDKRHYAHPELGLKDVTIFNEYIHDINSAIEFASEQSEEIYLIGLSLGGMIAPYIAESNSKVKGFVSLAGSPRNFEDIMLDQQVDAWQDMGYTKAQIELASIPVKTEIELIKSLKEGKEGELLLGIGTPYWHSLNQTTGNYNATNFSCPALILQGAKDFQIDAVKDYEYWKSLTKNKENVSYNLYDNLNHLFMQSNGSMDISEYNMSANVENKVIMDISTWILNL